MSARSKWNKWSDGSDLWELERGRRERWVARGGGGGGGPRSVLCSAEKRRHVQSPAKLSREELSKLSVSSYLPTSGERAYVSHFEKKTTNPLNKKKKDVLKAAFSFSRLSH